MTKSEKCCCFAFSETWWHFGIAQASLALLSVYKLFFLFFAISCLQFEVLFLFQF